MTAPDSPHRPTHHGSLLVIFLTVFVDLLGFGMVLPLLPIYAKQFKVDASGSSCSSRRRSSYETRIIPA